MNYGNIICTTAKNEDIYINNWVKYNLNLGFDYIFIFDNNDINKPLISSFIDEKYLSKIFIFDKRGVKEHGFQLHCTNNFYQEYNNQFNWCAFIDVDEFIVLRDWSNILDFLQDKRFDPYMLIRLKWHLYGDDDVIKRDLSVPPQNFFKNIITRNKISNQGKHIIRGGLNNVEVCSCHYSRINGNVQKQCLPSGKPCSSGITILEKYTDEAYINHYMTKTLDEFLNQKYGRGDAVFEKRDIDLDYFWRINKKTDNKLKYIQEWLSKYN